jgi:thiol-disulfide isomerase/thioredoxin
MIRWIALGVAAVLVVFGVVLAVNHRTETAIPRIVQQHRTVPAFTVTSLDGKPVASSALRGKTYVVNFFNSWCIPCQQEEPALQAFYAEHKNDPDFAMLGVVRDDEKGAVESYVKNNKIGWPVALDPGGTASLGFGTTGQPETYIVSSDGVAACGTLGPSTTAMLNTWLQGVRAGEVCK